MGVVYRHRRLDTNKIFYVGISNNINRAFDFNKRNKHWLNIFNITQISVEIIYNDIDFEDAKEVEIFLISEYGRRDLGLGTLVNMTDGGDGSLGYKHTNEHKDYMSISQKGILNHRYGVSPSLETSKKLSQRLTARQMGGNNHTARLVLDQQTGIYYDTIKEASIALCLKYCILKDWLSKPHRNKTNLRYA